VLREPRTVAGIARTMGITRQSVQRIADIMVEQGLAAYGPNPAHRRAKLLHATDEGRAAIGKIDPGHAWLAGRLESALGTEQFTETVRVLEQLSKALDTISGEEPPERSPRS
jgi:DNA-binding MarR family transcriptional regulator